MTECDYAIEQRISDRFEILDALTEQCINGDSRSLIVSGPAGLGKSYTVEKRLRNWDPEELNHVIVKGFVRATGLIKTFYKYCNPGQVIVFDDADSIFHDDVSLNLLKAVCDTTERRVVSWLSEGKLIDDETAELVPRSFEFHGSVIFITNYDFDVMIDRGHKLSPHLQALVSRSHYIDLDMRSRQDYLIRIRQVVADGMLSDLTIEEKADVLTFIECHSDELRELSLRMCKKLGTLRKNRADWERIARITCCR